MKVRCISDSVTRENSSQSIVNWANTSELEVTIGEIHTVFAISKHFDTLFYYILSDVSIEYPLAYPCSLFEICDNDITPNWDITYSTFQDIDFSEFKNGDIISFKEWRINGDRFYENLLEGNVEEMSVFKKYRDLSLGSRTEWKDE